MSTTKQANSGRVYVLDRRLDANGDLSDIRCALYITPVYCGVISRVEDIPLIAQFTQHLVMSISDEKAMETAMFLAQDSEMAVLVVGVTYNRLDLVAWNGEELCVN